MTTLTKNSNLSIIITAAGSSTRMGGSIKKEYLPLNNGTVLSNCAINFLNTDYNTLKLVSIVITHPRGGKAGAEEALKKDAEFSQLLGKYPEIDVQFVEGGNSRQSSVFNALEFLHNQNEKIDYVLIHDGARPFITPEVITNVVQAMKECGASVPGLTPVDTQKEVDENGFIIRHLKRNNLSAVQTPQGFEFEKLYEAHKKAAEDKQEYTDDTEIWGNYVGNVKVVEGSIKNKKITYPGDV